MKYVCDLWYEVNGHVTPYGEFFFENDKYPEPFEVGIKIKEDVKIDNEKPRQIELINKRIKELTTQISRYSDLYS